jgi:hypothetical protein
MLSRSLSLALKETPAVVGSSGLLAALSCKKPRFPVALNASSRLTSTLAENSVFSVSTKKPESEFQPMPRPRL